MLLCVNSEIIRTIIIIMNIAQLCALTKDSPYFYSRHLVFCLCYKAKVIALFFSFRLTYFSYVHIYSKHLNFLLENSRLSGFVET